MSEENQRKKIDSYKLGEIRVVISETDDPLRFHVECNDGSYRSSFKVRRYEYENYKRHMNQTITKAYKKQYQTAEEETERDQSSTE